MKKIICNLKLMCKYKRKIISLSKLQYLLISITKYKKINKEINIVIVDKKKIIELNKLYFNKNKVTNIITFNDINIPNTNIKIIGEIVICYKNIIKESKLYKIKFETLFLHNIMHGILHLIGYKHKLYKDLISMIKIETSIMKSMGYKNPYFL
ncbi:rRNA maturation RNase YbeY [Candidatus Annandia pinicola]|uniref:rRNA maturation RNase YbeY n=1 Tax=Candidatus Annandia pinicola TaxID=1345117 RepID=UPI001D030442|nr:rRNA maturation RNase YbeY [Candidatus Annandia pinicola]UDG80342.1 Endoribonuclease YbeY [Candidatus Annandia pinicola]